MSVGLESTSSKITAAKWGPVVLVAGVVLLAFAGLIFLLAITGGNARVTVEVYNYYVFVRMREPEASAELWVPVPDFPELRDRTCVTVAFADSGFPGRNVTQSIEESAYGTLFRFGFSESFAVWGQMPVAPGSANGTLTFNSQVSNDVWIYLTNISSGNQVSIILYYEVAQLRGFLSRAQVFFVGTADPRGGPETQLILGPGTLHEMIRDDKAYTVLSAGWGMHPLIDGGFAISGD